MGVVKDTHREFDASLTAAIATFGHAEEVTEGATASIEESGLCEEDDLDMDEEEPYGPQDVPSVQACLGLMMGGFNMLRILPEVMAGVCEHGDPSVESAVDPSPDDTPPAVDPTAVSVQIQSDETTYNSRDDNIFVAEIYPLCRRLKKSIVDLGMEMYAPLDIAGLKLQYEAVESDLVRLVEKAESYAPALTRAAEPITRMRIIVQDIHVRGECFGVSVDGS